MEKHEEKINVNLLSTESGGTLTNDTPQGNRRAWILNDVNEATNPIPREILIDYNDNYHIYFVADDAVHVVSPTKSLELALDKAMRDHIIGVNQHAVATTKFSGFLSASDKGFIENVKTMYEYMKTHPYLEKGIFKKLLPNGFFQPLEYEIVDNKFIIKPTELYYEGYYIKLSELSFIIPERPDKSDSAIEDIIALKIYINENSYETDKRVKVEVIYMPNTSRYLTELEDETLSYLKLFAIKRFNKEKFSQSNPFGSISTNIVDKHEIVPLWSQIVINDGNLYSILKEVGNQILQNKIEESEKNIVNLHFGTNKKSINEETLVFATIEDLELIDVVSGTRFDKGSSFTLAPTGLAISDSKDLGINIQLPHQLTPIFTLDFIIKSDARLKDTIMTFKDSSYNTIFNINMDGRYLFINDIKIIQLRESFLPVTLLFNTESKIVSVFINGVNMLKVPLELPDITKINFFELTSTKVIISDVRVNNGCYTDTHLSKDIQTGKGILLPPLLKGHRKLSNEISYQYNSIRLHYMDLGFKVDDKGVKWHKGDRIILDKNDNETIVGVYSPEFSLTTITGITSDNNLIVESVTGLEIGDLIKIIKYNSNIQDVYRIIDIQDNVLTMSKSDTLKLEKYDFKKNVIYSNIYKNNEKNSIVLHDDSTIIDTIQYTDTEGNIIIQLNGDSQEDYLYVDYTLITEYGELIPKMYDIHRVFVDNIEYEESVESKTEVISMKDVTLSVIERDISKPLESKDGLNIINSSADNATVRICIPFDRISNTKNVNERTIISNMLDSFKMTMSMASNRKIIIETNEQDITVDHKFPDTLTPYEFNFINAGRCINNDGDLIIDLIINNIQGGYLAIDDFKMELNLKTCSDSEKLFIKPGSNKPEDAIIIGTQTPYIKTVYNKNRDVQVVITATVDYRNHCIGKENNLKQLGYKAELGEGYNASLLTNNDDLYIEVHNQSDSILRRMPNRLVSKVGETNVSFV